MALLLKNWMVTPGLLYPGCEHRCKLQKKSCFPEQQSEVIGGGIHGVKGRILLQIKFMEHKIPFQLLHFEFIY